MKGGIKIDKNISIPIRKMKYPFLGMEINDSFAIDVTGKDARKIRTNLVCCALNFTKKHKPTWKFTTRTINNKVRIWRIK